MKKIRYYLRLFGAFISRFKVIIIFGVILGFIVALFSTIIIPRVINRNTTSIGLVGRYHPDELPDEVVRLISGGLTSQSENGTVSTGLAESWNSSDAKTWEFKLKGNQIWHDGEPVTSRDIHYEFSDVEVEKPDDYTIIFKLKEPFSPFSSVVSKPIFKQGLIGFGDWEVEKVRLAGSYVDTLNLKKDNEKLLLKFYPNEERAKLAYKLGKVDRLENLIEPEPFDKWENTQVESQVDTSKVVALLLNTQDPVLSDKSIRQGLSYAIPKSFDSKRAISPISPDNWAYNPQVKQYETDLVRAKELIDQMPDDLKSKPIHIASTPALLPIAEEIEKSWEELGLQIEVQVTSLVPNEYQTYLTIIDIPVDPDQYAYWHSTQSSSNLTHLSDDRIDKLLEDGRVEIDQEKRKKIYLDFQRFLLEEAPAIFLYHPKIYSVTR